MVGPSTASLKFRVIDGEYIVKILKRVVKHVYQVVLLSFVKVGQIIIPLIKSMSNISNFSFSGLTYATNLKVMDT